jgi:4-aminobutyrate aminotransferase-like enzyme
MIEMIEKDQIQHTSTIYLNHYAVDAAKALIEESPDGLDRVSFTNSGSEANETAFLAARHATGEAMIVNLRHSYHGGTAATLANCGQHTWRFRAQPVASVTSAMEPYCYRCPFNKEPTSCNLECAQNVETTIQTTTHGKIAGMIVEPVMGVGGFISPPDRYFHEVSKIVHNYGGKLIIDEVQTGAGRSGASLLLAKGIGIDCDMVTMAKGFGNGAAIGAVLMKSEIAETLAGKVHFNTFGGDPYQTMQAKVTLDIIKEQKLVENAKIMGAALVDGLRNMMRKYNCIGDVRGRGLLLGVEIVKDPKSKTIAADDCATIMDLAKEKGLLVGKGGLNGNVIRLAPPLTVTKEHIDFMLEVFEQCFAQVQKRKV